MDIPNVNDSEKKILQKEVEFESHILHMKRGGLSVWARTYEG